MNNMKSLTIIIASIMFTVIAAGRVNRSERIEDLVMAVSFAAFFGVCSLFLLFEERIKNSSLFISLRSVGLRRKKESYYVVVLLGLILFEFVIYFYIPSSYAAIILKYLLAVFFALGIAILLFFLTSTASDDKK